MFLILYDAKRGYNLLILLISSNMSVGQMIETLLHYNDLATPVDIKCQAIEQCLGIRIGLKYCIDSRIGCMILCKIYEV